MTEVGYARRYLSCLEYSALWTLLPSGSVSLAQQSLRSEPSFVPLGLTDRAGTRARFTALLERPALTAAAGVAIPSDGAANG